MKPMSTYINDKHPKKQYACFQDKWDDNSAYYVYEKVDGNTGQKLNMSKTQFENFELILKMNGWQQAA